MTDPLVETFFKRNLTEAEAEALEGLLERSPESALEFGENLKREYLGLGLTVPEIPRNWGWPAAHGLSLVKTLLVVAGLGAAGLAARHYWPRTIPAIAPRAVAPARALPRVHAAPPPRVHPKAPLPPPPVEISGKPEGDGGVGNRLSVVVEMEKTSPVDVRILDDLGRNVRSLYQGTLQAGQWSLHWDGLLADGSKAPPGNYRIQVESGATRMSKNITIEPGP
jgi:FlgD Ig-like domain